MQEVGTACVQAESAAGHLPLRNPLERSRGARPACAAGGMAGRAAPDTVTDTDPMNLSVAGQPAPGPAWRSPQEPGLGTQLGPGSGCGVAKRYPVLWSGTARHSGPAWCHQATLELLLWEVQASWGRAGHAGESWGPGSSEQWPLANQSGSLRRFPPSQGHPSSARRTLAQGRNWGRSWGWLQRWVRGDCWEGTALRFGAHVHLPPHLFPS